jgi:hypothetical protein
MDKTVVIFSNNGRNTYYTIFVGHDFSLSANAEGTRCVSFIRCDIDLEYHRIELRIDIITLGAYPYVLRPPPQSPTKCINTDSPSCYLIKYSPSLPLQR